MWEMISSNGGHYDKNVQSFYAHNSFVWRRVPYGIRQLLLKPTIVRVRVGPIDTAVWMHYLDTN